MVEDNVNSRILAEAVGGKTARACDGCVKRRARWYCAADDAFLCQSCDVTVHSANSLARRHDRVRLKSSSFSAKPSSCAATWHQGFTRKPRTPRSGGAVKKSDRPVAIHDLVPEIGIENDTENNSEEERLFYQVPEFDPIVSDDSNGNGNVESCLNGFFPTEKELAEFAADVETLFGNGPENENFAIEELGQRSNSFALKVEADQSEGYNECYNHGIVEGDPFDLSFDYDSRASFMEEDDEKKVGTVKKEGEQQKDADDDDDDEHSKRKNSNKKDLMLSLDYESVIATWGGQGPPWMAGGPPEFDPDDQNWPACLSVNGGEELQQQYGVVSRMQQAGFTDEGREARVSRYREKRRTRLFSKKIRYEVRKLNAEKRPRLKGRFVKRSAFALLSSS